ncbi:MAG: NAD(P)-dependent alcohol dehydrogenase [Alphaproteobacteria bacterium]|nr:NAD(P)-dependent alcohol dehydrogenase [Alphaproteobacteria bacterium]
MAETMRVWLSDEPGHENLMIEERPIPKPGPGEVLLKMKAGSLNYRDTIVVKNQYAAPTSRPIVPLSDGCGEVAAIGEGVTRVKEGDRVAPLFFQDWMSGPRKNEYVLTALGGGIDGCLAEYMCLREQGVVKVPKHLTDQEVATLPCAALTAWNTLNCTGDLKAGDLVVCQGTGGVSIFALQFAKMAGAEVVVTSSSDEKLQQAEKLGADHLINYKENPKWGSKVMEITDGRGADIVVEVGGPGTMGESLKALRTNGFIGVIGVLTGQSGEVATVAIMGKSARVQGISVGSRDWFEDMCRAININQLKPVISDTFGFDDAKSAFETMQSQSHFGKIVIDYKK